MSGGRIEGWFISWESDEELQYVQDSLTDAGYEAGPKGLREFVLDILQEPAKPERPAVDKLVDQVNAFIKANPDKVNMYGTMLGSMAMQFANNLLKTKK